MNKNVLITLITACLLFLGACGNSAIQSTSGTNEKTESSSGGNESIKIGALLPNSGVYASLGKNLNRGMELYFEEINWEVEGKKIEIINEDSEADPQVSLRKTRKLIEQDNIDILTGTVSTAVAYAIRDEVDSKRMPFLVSHAGGNDLTRSKRSDYIWRSSFSSWQIGNSMGEWAYENVGKKIYLTAADYAFGKEVSAAFKEAYTAAGGKIAGEVYPPLENNDYSSYLTTISGSDADAVYAFFAGSDAVRFVQQYEQYGVKEKMPLIGSGWLVSEDLRASQGNASEGTLAATFWDYNLQTDENKKFVTAYEKKYGERPTLESLEGYDAARIIAEAVKSLKGDVSDSKKVVDAFSEVNFQSPRGEFKFDKETHHVIQDMYITKAKLVDGKSENEVIGTVKQVKDPGK
ncbi:ABC transporter substrate-binding protein [Domibacillus epiphyticus]|uniref:ABC transporter substrate-binding protein n=1 Tax=Domibacillus epiphyticus TaxID=1714355 RepID=A0A1V2A8Y7_9BACI|nr:ABC transporter substrate-binding protein [Domibacillus epiphyticus]OMP67284.1 ABC transporter substrate-binding protein [Domibacillus epiphyticus]